jgi:uncharacterized protein (TIGR04255 family)
LPCYQAPPVNEVVCSILFAPIEALLTPHVGLLWQRFQPEYPFCHELAPVIPRVEFFNDQVLEHELEFTDIPPLPRVWFISADNTKIVQIQRDRLIHNWRKIGEESEYPRYVNMIKGFQEHLNTFTSFIKEADFGEINILQYELSYVNQILQGDGWKTLEDIGKIFPDFKWQIDGSRFLQNPDNINWNMIFDLPEKMGRLHLSIRTINRETGPSILFELTVRGIGGYNSLDSLESWFDLAHEYIVQAFADLTDEKIQTDIWKRIG